MMVKISNYFFQVDKKIRIFSRHALRLIRSGCQRDSRYIFAIKHIQYVIIQFHLFLPRDTECKLICPRFGMVKLSHLLVQK